MTSWPRALQPWSPWPAAYVACGNTFRTKPSDTSIARIRRQLGPDLACVMNAEIAAL